MYLENSADMSITESLYSKQCIIFLLSDIVLAYHMLNFRVKDV